MVTQNALCAIIGCQNPITDNSLVCALSEHQEVQRIHQERGQARFQLQQRLQRARVAHPNDALPNENSEEDVSDSDEYEVDSRTLNPVPTTTPRKKLRAQFGRRRTHNEQIIVAPCGIILARETFYGAEGIGYGTEYICGRHLCRWAWLNRWTWLCRWVR